MSSAQWKSHFPTIRIIPLWWVAPIVLSAVCILLAVVLSARTGTPLSNFYHDAMRSRAIRPHTASWNTSSASPCWLTGAIVLFTTLTEAGITAKTSGAPMQ
ncbi:hypothetical protein [Fulvimarina sp. MAC8]|uniref:hypothetical protein n=1 Tax=Fulvimarina sp. MAC8 TaxID=3162874 RepID=UPI0032ED2240